MMKTIFLFSLLLTSSFCRSQFNDSLHYYLRFASTGIVNTTNNANSYVFNNGLLFKIKKKKVAINTALNWIYGAQQHNITNNDFNVQGYLNFYKGIHKLYYWGLVNYDKSHSLKINHRSQIGAGVAYNIIDSPALRINISDGILYEQGDLIDATLGRDVYQIPRNSFRLLYHWSLKDKLIIDGVHFLQPSLTDFNDYIINSSNNISVKLRKWLSITAAIAYNKVNRTKRENLLITYGITMETYF